MNEADSRRGDGLLWGVIAAWAAITLTSFFAPAVLSANAARYVNVALMSAFTLVHGARRYGWAGIAVYFVIACVVANTFENLSIVTGFPFGQYHHTAAMGPKLFHVPLIIGPIFAVAGYLAWVVAGILLGEAFGAPARGIAVARCLCAAAVTTMWDLCVDAIGGTVSRDWVWAGGGAFFGVPWQNFAGWLLTMWVIFQVFAVYLARRGDIRPVPVASPYWLQPVVFWLLIGLQFPLLALIVPEGALSDPAGVAWTVKGLFTAMAIVSVFTMSFTALLAWVLLARARAGH
ncbi:MAG: carotenoid biosynthesis protein [Gammaproteobacteria bacterium]